LALVALSHNGSDFAPSPAQIVARSPALRTATGRILVALMMASPLVEYSLGKTEEVVEVHPGPVVEDGVTGEV
jgi:hypothetical protein